jgi:flagellar assembly protein FliH
MGIISKNSQEEHVISSYDFVSLNDVQRQTQEILADQQDFEPMDIFNPNAKQPENEEQEKPEPKQPTSARINSSSTKQHLQILEEQLKSRDEMIQKLLQKADNLSSEFLKMQMKLEDQENLFKDQVKQAQTKAFEEGVQEGRKLAENDLASQYQVNLEQFNNSLNEVNLLKTNLNKTIKSIEKELVFTSIDIAKEVVQAEITFNSSQVAVKLTESLLSNLSDASEIKLRVNPTDFDFVKESFAKMKDISVIPDRAVSTGGIIVISDVGTIEGNIMERYKKLKLEALSSLE